MILDQKIINLLFSAYQNANWLKFYGSLELAEKMRKCEVIVSLISNTNQISLHFLLTVEKINILICEK